MPRDPTRRPLYRKVNTRARGVRHRSGSDYRHERHTRHEARSDERRGSMHGRPRRGLDYTPLFKFLLSKVGSRWDEVYSEAVARLDRAEPIFWMVALHEDQRRDVVLLGETSYYSGLHVDDDGLLQRVNPAFDPRGVVSCTCCTHSFNGVPIPNRARAREASAEGG